MTSHNCQRRQSPASSVAVTAHLCSALLLHSPKTMTSCPPRGTTTVAATIEHPSQRRDQLLTVHFYNSLFVSNIAKESKILKNVSSPEAKGPSTKTPAQVRAFS